MSQWRVVAAVTPPPHTHTHWVNSALQPCWCADVVVQFGFL